MPRNYKPETEPVRVPVYILNDVRVFRSITGDSVPDLLAKAWEFYVSAPQNIALRDAARSLHQALNESRAEALTLPEPTPETRTSMSYKAWVAAGKPKLPTPPNPHVIGNVEPLA